MYIRRLIRPIVGVIAVSLLMAGMSQAASTKARRHAHRPAVRITASQATATALKRFPGKTVEKTRLENEEGVWQYSVMVRSGKTLREVMVNAKTGKIDSVEVTNAAKERNEERADAAHKVTPRKASPRK